MIDLQEKKILDLKQFVDIKLATNEWEKTARCESYCQSQHARQVLAETLERNNIVHNLDKLKYSDHITGFIWSLSHTKGASCCALVKEALWPCIRSIGVDIEKKDRQIPDILKGKISHADDFITDPLCVWVIKESIYKAVSKLYSDSFDLNNIILHENTFSFNLQTRIKGIYQFGYEDNYIFSGGVVLT